MVDRIKEALQDTKSHLAVANIRMKRLADNSKRDETFREGDKAVLSTENLR